MAITSAPRRENCVCIQLVEFGKEQPREDLLATLLTAESGHFCSAATASRVQILQSMHNLYISEMSTAGPPLTLRERRRKETHDEIRRVALALVQGRGYDGVTVDLISERAGVSVRTFFNYFPNKESAMIAIPPSIPESAAERFLSRSGPHDLFADLADLAVSMFAEGNSAPSDFESSVKIVMSVPALATVQQGALLEREHQFIELIAARLTRGPDDEQPAVIAAALTGAIRVACQRWSRTDGRRPFGEEVRACVTLLSTAATDASARKRAPARRNR